jgi:DNA-binding transcriptional LysR family regulator
MRELNKLQTFVRVVEHQSFTKAARELRVSSSVISKHIKDLEEALGFSVLKRSTRGVAPTEAGQSIFQSCATLFGEIDRVITDARNIETGPVGTLRVQCDPAYAEEVVVPLLPEFAAEYPNVRIELSAPPADGPSRQARYDVIIAQSPAAEPGMAGRRIAPVPHLICASPGYLRSRGTPKKPQDLRDHNCLVDTTVVQKEWQFTASGRKFLVEAKGNLFSNDPKILAAMAAQGLGIARLPFYIARPYIAQRKLTPLFERSAISRESMHAYHLRSERLPAKTEAFVALLQRRASGGSTPPAS